MVRYHELTRCMSGPVWQQYDNSDLVRSHFLLSDRIAINSLQAIMDFGEEMSMIRDDYREEQIDFLNSVYTVLAQ